MTSGRMQQGAELDAPMVPSTTPATVPPCPRTGELERGLKLAYLDRRRSRGVSVLSSGR